MPREDQARYVLLGELWSHTMGTDEDWALLLLDLQESKLVVEETHSPGMYRWEPSQSNYSSADEYLRLHSKEREKAIALMREYVAAGSPHKDKVEAILAGLT